MPEVRQSSFALLGDLTKACYVHVHPCIPGATVHVVLRILYNVAICRLHADPVRESEPRVHLCVQQRDLGRGRDLGEAGWRDVCLHPAHPRAAHHHHQPAQHAQDAAGEHGHHHRADGAGVSPDGGPVPAAVRAALVHQPPQHPRQRREGLRLPRHVSDDQRQPQRRRPRLHLLLRRGRQLVKSTGGN